MKICSLSLRHSLILGSALMLSVAGFSGRAEAGAGAFEYSASAYNTAYNAGTVVVTVERVGGSTGAVKVGVNTHPGTALNGVDFDAVNQWVNWADGDASAKTVSIPIINHSFTGTHSFSLGLSGETGAPLGSPSTAEVNISGSGGTSPPPPPPANSKPISDYVSCTGTADDDAGVIKAFAAAKNNAFTLNVNCPVFMHIGSGDTGTIFIDNGTTVQFTGSGKFIVDNILRPAFAIIDTSNVKLLNWNVEFTGIVPVKWPGGGNSWNDTTATQWLQSNRSVNFASGIHNQWAGIPNGAAMFYIAGNSQNITIDGLNAYSVSPTQGYRFITTLMSFGPDWKPGTSPMAGTPCTTSTQYCAAPSNVVVSNSKFDGTIMGIVGSGLQNSQFTNIESDHYSDLQDANGGNVGGVGKWFAPPHLFYLSGAAPWNNANLTFTNINDKGERVGVARDTVGNSGSGVADSIKIGGKNITINGYTSNRPDGLIAILWCDGEKITNLTGSYDSSFVHGLYPGVWFPQTPVNNLIFSGLQVTDTASTAIGLPIGSASGSGFTNIDFTNNSTVNIHAWDGGDGPVSNVSGQIAGSLRTYYVKNTDAVYKAGPN